MDENVELLEYIYKNAEMGVYSCEKLIQDINNKENKIKKLLEGILKGYENFKKDSKKYINKSNYELKKSPLIAKISSSVQMKMEVAKDNSDSAIAKLLTQGLTMGSVNISAKIDRYEKNADKKVLKLAKNYLKFQKESIDFLKDYL